MTATTCEMIWLESFVQNLGITTPMPMPMHCDNQEVSFISGNLAFHERTKHIDIECHFIRDKVLMGVIFLHHMCHHRTSLLTSSRRALLVCRMIA